MRKADRYGWMFRTWSLRVECAPGIRKNTTLRTANSIAKATIQSTQQMRGRRTRNSCVYKLILCNYILGRTKRHARSEGTNTYAVVNLHSFPHFSHCTHLGSAGSHLIFFSRHVLQAIASRLRGLPAFVTPHCALTGSPSMTFLQVVPSS